jgi:hypothetical protein
MRILLVVAMFAAVAGADPKPTPKLAVTAIEPSKGDADGGTYVRINGSRFLADGARSAKVYFGNHAGTVVRFASDSEMIVQAPGGKPNETVDVIVMFEPGGEHKLPKAFTFVEKQGPTP